MLDGLRFIELKGKVPRTTFDQNYTKQTADKWDDAGVIVESPYVVVDIDDPTEFEILYRIVEARAIKTRIMRTTRGGHFWFKSSKAMRNIVDHTTALGINIDIRSGYTTSMVVVKQAQRWRDWIKYDEDVDEYPYWLLPVNHDYNFLGMKKGDGRNDTFFRYMITLINAGLSREQVRTTFEIINEFIMRDPLDSNELATITRDQAFENIHEPFFDGKRFQHNVFAQYFSSDNNVFMLNGRLYMYANGWYSDDELMINRRMIDYIRTLTSVQRREVMSYLYLIADEPIEKSPYFITTQNGMIDIREPNTLKPFTPDVFTTNMVNATYDPLAYDEVVDKTIDKLVQNDSELRLVMEEMIGYCLLPTARFQKALLLTGGGSNGKSTFLEMLSEFLGSENVSSLSLSELNHNFKLSEITSKLANIGDDISGEYLEDTSIFKKLVTGEDITVDKKNEQPYKLRNTAKLIFASNDLPMSSDKSDGMERRLTIVPFNARFRTTDEDYDPFIIDKLTSDNARSYLLNLGISGAKRLFEQNGFTESQVAKNVLREYQIENNNVLGFLEVHDIEDGRDVVSTFEVYQLWCAQNGIQPYKRTRFVKLVRESSEYTNVNTTRGGVNVQIWRKS